jgi:hypothetical protein
MKADAPQLDQGRALVGFALAQAGFGDEPTFLAATPADSRTLAQRLEYLVSADSFAGQPRLVAWAIVHARAEQQALDRLAGDPMARAPVRLLARLIAGGLRHERLPDALWPLAVDAARTTDVRTVWTWLLVFVPTIDARATELGLRKRLPLSDEHERYFYSEYVAGRQR